MKTYNEYINYLDLLESHFKLEFDVRNNANSTINISEKYGRYDGEIEFIVELSKILFKDIKFNNDKDIRYDINKEDLDKDFNNIFFKKITIIYKDTLNSGYDNTHVEYDELEKLLNNVIIYINARENNTYNDIITTLVHEITHAWEDYNRYIKNDNISLYSITKHTNYKELVNKINSFKDFGDLCAKILYMFKRFERNAYISELVSELDKEHSEILSYKDALELFKNTDVYKEYIILYDAFKKFYKEQQFIDFYNKSNNSKLTANKIYNKLNNQFEKTFNKISSLIPKVYYDYYIKQQKDISECIMIKPSKGFIEQLNILM